MSFLRPWSMSKLAVGPLCLAQFTWMARRSCLSRSFTPHTPSEQALERQFPSPQVLSAYCCEQYRQEFIHCSDSARALHGGLHQVVKHLQRSSWLEKGGRGGGCH